MIGRGSGEDEIDTSRCSQFAVQVSSASGPTDSTYQVEQTMDGTNWADLGSAQPVTLGDIARFPITGGPYGKIRITVIDNDVSESVESAGEEVHARFTIVGWEMQTVA